MTHDEKLVAITARAIMCAALGDNTEDSLENWENEAIAAIAAIRPIIEAEVMEKRIQVMFSQSTSECSTTYVRILNSDGSAATIRVSGKGEPC